MTFLWVFAVIGAVLGGYFIGAACVTCAEIDLEERVSTLYWALRVLVEAVEQPGDDGTALGSAMEHAKSVIREDNR